MEIKELKLEYKKLAEKYKLPGFEEVDEEFEIDKIDRKSDFLLRLVRKVMMEKIVNSLQFLDMLVNPMNAPRIYFPYIKSMSSEDKKKIDKIYGELGKLSINSLYLEVNTGEKYEAEMVQEIFDTWVGVKADFKAVLGNMKTPSGEGMKRDRNYFG